MSDLLLSYDGFDEAELQPMELPAVCAFIHHWHRAVAEELPDAQDRERLGGLATRLERVVARTGDATEFEILVALAVQHLAPRADRLVVEVGMGGRLDSTNVLDLGVAVVDTGVDLGHPDLAALDAYSAYGGSAPGPFARPISSPW